MDFYHKDDISRMCPGKKDFLSVVNLETGKKRTDPKKTRSYEFKRNICVI